MRHPRWGQKANHMAFHKKVPPALHIILHSHIRRTLDLVTLENHLKLKPQQLHAGSIEWMELQKAML